MSDWTVYRIDGQTLQDMGRCELHKNSTPGG